MGSAERCFVGVIGWIALRGVLLGLVGWLRREVVRRVYCVDVAAWCSVGVTVVMVFGGGWSRVEWGSWHAG